MTTETETESAAARIDAIAAAHGLTMTAEFVPLSASRNAKPREDGRAWRSLNWRVAIRRNGKPVAGLEAVDYAQGEAHAPAYKARAFAENRFARDRAITIECETGRLALGGVLHPEARAGAKPLPAPPLHDVLWSLSLDASALDHPTFESWAEDYGYSTDSRSAESTYRACLATGLALRAAIGESGLEALREAAADY